MTTRPITLTVNEDGHRLTITASPKRFQEILATTKCLPKLTPKRVRAAAMRPAEKRVFPKFRDGMSTSQYAQAYSQANARFNLTPDDQFFAPLSTNPQHAQVADTDLPSEVTA